MRTMIDYSKDEYANWQGWKLGKARSRGSSRISSFRPAIVKLSASAILISRSREVQERLFQPQLEHMIFTMLVKSICRGCLRQSAPQTSLFLSKRCQSTATDYSHLQTELPFRKLPILYDDLTTRNAHNLNVSLASFLPKDWLSSDAHDGHLPSSASDLCLAPAFHLVYFNPALPASKLLADGTDPNQSPGDPFVRRMWAGGQVRFNPARERDGNSSKRARLVLDGSRYACVEGIRDVTIKGKPGSEKVFVGIERRFGPAYSHGEEDTRSRLWSANEDDFNESTVIERRNIVFMRERTAEELQAVKEAGAAPPPGKMLLRI